MDGCTNGSLKYDILNYKRLQIQSAYRSKYRPQGIISNQISMTPKCVKELNRVILIWWDMHGNLSVTRRVRLD